MSDERSGDGSGYFKRFKRAALSAASDEHRAMMEGLEQALAEERNKAAALQDAADNLHFQIEVLEKGYAKQLEDARLRAEAAAQSQAETESKLADLAAAHEQAIQSLTETRAELQHVKAERNRLRRQIEGHGETDELADDGEEADLPEGTINRLLAARPSRRKRQPEGDSGSGGDDEAPSEELMPPELMLRDKKNDS